jgi:DNA-binding response OmpR family regulator
MSKRILIAEDEPDILRMFSDILISSGFTVESVGDGAAAIAAMQKSMPDLLLLDMQMPKVDGFGVLEFLQEQPEKDKVTVLVLSNVDNPEWIAKAREMGAREYWLKADTHLMEFVTKVRELLGEDS